MKKLGKILLGALATLTLASCDLSNMMGGFSFPGLDGITNSTGHGSLNENIEGSIEEKMLSAFMDYCQHYGDTALSDWLMRDSKFVNQYIAQIDGADHGISLTFTNGETINVHDWSIYVVKQWPNCTWKGEAIIECRECGELKKFIAPATGIHEFNPSYDIISPTCTEEGVVMYTCSYCGIGEERSETAYGHDWNLQNLPCGFVGTALTNCWRCGEISEVTVDTPTEHRQWDGYSWSGGENYGNGWLFADSEETYCPYDNTKRVRWMTDQVTPECAEKKEIEYFHERSNEFSSKFEPNHAFRRGIEFFGRPIGNAIELDFDGRKAGKQDFPSENIEGSFIEYRFRTNREMNDVKLKSFLAPDQEADVADIWKSLGNIHGYDFTSELASTTEQGFVEILDFNVILYIDGIRIDFDRNIDTPVINDPHYKENEGLYSFPMEGIYLPAGEHTVKLVQAAGIRHSFYDFFFEEEYDGTNSGGNSGSLIHQYGEPLGGHDISADSLYGSSGGRKIICNLCNGIQGYEFRAEDALSGQLYPDESGMDKSTRLGKNDIFEDVWSIQGLDRGTYDVYLKARCAQAQSHQGYWNSATAIMLGGIPTNNGATAELQNDYKYKIATSNGAADNYSEWINVGNDEDNYPASGLNESYPSWTTKVVATVTFNQGDTRLTLKNMNNGYSIWVYSLCLIKIA